MTHWSKEGAGCHTMTPAPITTYAAAILAATSREWLDECAGTTAPRSAVRPGSPALPPASTANARQRAAAQASAALVQPPAAGGAA